MGAVRTICFAVALIAGSSVARAQELPPGEMRDTVWAACNSCHKVNRFTGMRKTRAGWIRTMNSMIDKGAVIGDNEYDRLVDYLTTNFGPLK